MVSGGGLCRNIRNNNYCKCPSCVVGKPDCTYTKEALCTRYHCWFTSESLSVFFFVLGRLYPELLDIAKSFPTTVYSLQKLLGVRKDMFVRYVTCPKCYAIYQYSQCIEVSGTRKSSKCCSNESCKSLLLRSVETSDGRQLLYPFKTYRYRPLKESLQEFLNSPGFSESCEKWCDLRKEDGMLAEIYDGRIWQEFQEYKIFYLPP